MIIIDEAAKVEAESVLAREWRDSELLLADIEINKILDGDGDGSTPEGRWRMYRRDLRSWPDSEGFPGNGRPIRPSTEKSGD